MAVAQTAESPSVSGSENGFEVSGRWDVCATAMAGFKGQKYDPPNGIGLCLMLLGSSFLTLQTGHERGGLAQTDHDFKFLLTLQIGHGRWADDRTPINFEPLF